MDVWEQVKHLSPTWRVYAGRPDVAIEDEKVLDPPPGEPVTEESGVGRAANYLGRFVITNPRSWLPRADPEDSVYLKDASAAAQWVRIATSLISPELPPAEVEHLEKFCIQSGGPPYWSIDTEGFYLDDDEVVDMDIAERGFKFLELYLDRSMAPFGTRVKAKKGFPTTTNGGAPHYLKGPKSVMCDAMAAGASFGGDPSEDYARYATIWGSKLRAHATMSNRTKPTRKSVNILTVAEDGVRHRGSTYKLIDLRKVFMGVRYDNMQHGVANAPIGLALESWYSTRHTTPDATINIIRMVLRKYGKGGGAEGAFSEDLSGYDRSQRLILQLRLQKVYDEYLLPYESQLYTFIRDSAIMGGPWRSDELGYMYDKRGVLASGTLFTSKDGTCLNIVRIAASMCYAMNWTAEEAWIKYLKREWGFLVWGDDTVLMYPKNFDRARYEEGTDRIGFATTSDPEVVFLMKRYYEDTDGQLNWHPVGSRVYQQTISPEHGRGDPSDPEVRLISVLGLWSRTLHAEFSPLWNSIEKYIVGREGAIWNQGLTRLREHVMSSSFKRALHESQLAREFAEELRARDDRGDSPASFILEGAGVTATGRSKAAMLDWIATEKSERLKTKLWDWAKRIADTYETAKVETGEEQLTGRSFAQQRTDKLKRREHEFKSVVNALESDPELSALTDLLTE